MVELVHQVPGFIEKLIRCYYKDFLKLEKDDYGDLIFGCKAVEGASLIPFIPGLTVIIILLIINQ